MNQWVRFWVLAAVALAPRSASLLHAQAGAGPPSRALTFSIPDTVVLDQDNRKLHFYSDLIKGKTVAVNFIFTTCTTICPPLTANFAKLQKIMRDRGAKDFQLISVSVDPETDTPEKLKRYAELFAAKPGWTFVTGTRADLEPVWRAFKVYTSNKLDHTAMVVIGNDTQHTWMYASGLSSAKELARAIDSVPNNKEPVNASAAAYKEGHGNSQQ
jgi:protein SCO1